jgi:hypothetical protein
MKSILIAFASISILVAGEFLCLRAYDGRGPSSFPRNSLKAVAKWVDTAPVPAVIGWGLSGVGCLFLANAKKRKP